jgi:F-type H+-transporting ATPase subunit b
MIKLDYTLVVTIFYIVVLYAFMSRLFFKPIARILKERRQLIEGRLQAAQLSVAEADRKAQEYEQELKAARTETFRLQEAQRDKELTERTELLNRSKADSDRTVQETRTSLLSEAESAAKTLDAEVAGLAGKLTTVLLQEKS